MEWTAYLDTIIWTVAFITFLVIEISSFNLITIWFAGGSLFNVFLTLIKITDLQAPYGAEKRSFIPLIWQIFIFLAISITGIILFFPKLKKRVQKGRVNTNVDAMAGKEGVVTDKISAHSTGQVKVEGQVWTAISADGTPIEEGAEIMVETVKGVKAIVKIKPNQED